MRHKVGKGFYLHGTRCPRWAVRASTTHQNTLASWAVMPCCENSVVGEVQTGGWCSLSLLCCGAAACMLADMLGSK